MPRNPVPLNQLDKMPRLIESQRRLGKVRILRKKILRAAVQIRKIASPAAGDENFYSMLTVLFQQLHAPAAMPRHRRAHQPRRART